MHFIAQVMLKGNALKEEIDTIIDLLVQLKNDEARQKMEQVRFQISSEHGKGALLALYGVLNSMTKPKNSEEGIDVERILRTTDKILRNQIIDDLDKGYFQTLSKWAKRSKELRLSNNETKSEEKQPKEEVKHNVGS
jgi:hypothetical protein